MMKGYCNKCGVPILIPIISGDYNVRPDGYVRKGHTMDDATYFVFLCHGCGGVNEIDKNR